MAFVYIQEGGSSVELYLHIFDTEADAEDGRKSCAESAYRTSDIVEVPEILVSTAGNITALEEILKAVATLGH